MKPLPESVIDPVISDALAAVETAKENVRTLVRDTQSRCEHRFVSEAPWTSIQPARRICNHCRLVEIGTHWSGGATWSKHGHEPATLGNVEGRIVVPVGQEIFRKMEIRT